MKIVDLGTKHGEAISHFRSKAGLTVLPRKEVARCVPGQCVGYERPEAASYRKKVESRGYQFELADLSVQSNLATLPESSIYLAWHVLEHLPDKMCADRVVQTALDKAKRLAWFRLPSFEQDDDQGEGVLRKLGLRFSWTYWAGHPTAWLVSDCVASITTWEIKNPDRPFELIVKPAGYIKSTDDKRVVPISAPIDTNYYSPKLGAKPKGVAFKPFIVSEWEVIVRFPCE